MKFEDLEVWKRSTRLSVDLFKATKGIKDYNFRDQITRSGLSIPSNIAEGYERGSLKDSIRFLYIAKASCGELRTQIYIGQEVGYIPSASSLSWIDETKVISKQLASLIKTRRGFAEKVSRS
jgi:four helix bundle protein